jgi:hypothetical protein
MEALEISNSIVRNLETVTTEIKMLEENMKKSMIEHAWEIGKRLSEVKDDLQHGNFGEWIEENFEFTIRYAQQFILFFKQNPNTKLTSHLPSWTHCVEILSLPDSIDREEFISNSHTIPSTGQDKMVDEMTVRELREVNHTHINSTIKF